MIVVGVCPQSPQKFAVDTFACVDICIGLLQIEHLLHIFSRFQAVHVWNIAISDVLSVVRSVTYSFFLPWLPEVSPVPTFFQWQVAKVKARSFITFCGFLDARSCWATIQPRSPKGTFSTFYSKRKVSFAFALFSNCDATQVRPPLVPNILSQLFTNGAKIFESVHVLSAWTMHKARNLCASDHPK